MTQLELIEANAELPERFAFVPEIGIECYEEDEVLPMHKIKNFFDYLNSINVNPYAE